MQSLSIGTLFASVGEKTSGYLAVEGTEVKLPITIICGDNKGKTLLITGGVHNAEYVGIQAAIELAAEITPQGLSGNIIIAPLINVTGFENRTMSVVYEDGKNLNRHFPGDKEGTLADKICYTVVKELHTAADYYIDLHCGDGYEQLTPYVYYLGMAEPDVVEASKKMAECVDAKYMVKSPTSSGGSYNYAGSSGIPSILIERGSLGIWSKEEVEQDKKDVINILKHLGIMKGELAERKHKPVDVGNMVYENAQYTGCWYPTKCVGDLFGEGEILGDIKDYFGNTLQKVVAKADGIMLYQVASLCILEGGSMVAYGKQKSDF